MKKNYVKSTVDFESIEQDAVLKSSNRGNKPGWGPDKDSDDDGHHMPPGHDKHGHDDCIEDECFEVF